MTGVKTCAVVKLSRIPKYVRCIVNPKNPVSTTEDLSTRTVDEQGNDGNFYMSSSTYWDTSNSNAVTSLTEIKRETMITDDKSDAKTATKVKPIKLRVEPIVAKVQVVDGLTSTTVKPVESAKEEGTGTETNAKAGQVKYNDATSKQVEAVVEFTPKAVLLTGYKESGYTFKKLPAFDSETDKAWSDYNDITNKRSGWVGATSGSPSYYKFNEVITNTTTTGSVKTDVMYSAAYGANVFYPFENAEEYDVNKTSIVVLGKYDAYERNANGTADTSKKLSASDGTFYLLGVGSSFTVFNDLATVIEKMGGSAKKADGSAKTPAELEAMLDYDLADATDSKSWTGWMTLKDGPKVIKCIKYKGGYGYYSQPIVRATVGNNVFKGIVRNTHYTLTIKTIQGMGVGIPNDDTPIIHIPNPDPNNQNYYMHIGIEVLPWVELPKFDVEWK